MSPKAERENIINWSEGDTTARLYICSKKMKNRLAKYNVEPIEKDDDEPYGATYEVPRNWVRVQKPSGEGRVSTPAQKKARIARLAAAREARAAARAKAGKPKKTSEVVEDDEEEETTTTKATSKLDKLKAMKKPAPAVVEEDDEEVEVVKPKKKSA